MLIIRMLNSDVAFYIFLLLSENKRMPEIRVTNRATRTWRRKTILFDTLLRHVLFIYDILFSRLWKMKVIVLNYVKNSGVIFNSSNAIFCQKRYTYWQFIHLRISIIKVLLLKVLYANGSQNYLNIFYKEIHSIWKFWLIEVCRAYVEHNKLYMELFFSLSMKNLLERMKLKKRKT